MSYNPQRLLLNALAVCQVFGESKEHSETRLITTYLDRHVKIECDFNDEADSIVVFVWQVYRSDELRDVLVGYIPIDTEHPPRIAFTLQLNERHDSPLIRWEKRITDLFMLHQTSAIVPCFSWDLATMDDNPGWSQITAYRGKHAQD